MGWTKHWVPKCGLKIEFLASNSLHNREIKNNHAHVTTQRILNKFIEINFSVGCMVWPWWCLFQHGQPVKILIRWKYFRKYFNSLSLCNQTYSLQHSGLQYVHILDVHLCKYLPRHTMFMNKQWLLISAYCRLSEAECTYTSTNLHWFLIHVVKKLQNILRFALQDPISQVLRKTNSNYLKLLMSGAERSWKKYIFSFLCYCLLPTGFVFINLGGSHQRLNNPYKGHISRTIDTQRLNP